MSRKIKLIEIGPRDGFQSVKEFIPTKTKLAIIDGLIDAGYQKLQITSFVSEKAIPQMKDARQVTEAVLAEHRDVSLFALVPNFYGAQAAYEAGLREVSPVMSLSVSHNQANVRRTHEQSLEELARIRSAFPDLTITQDIATVFGCPYEGRMSVDALLELIEKIRLLGIHSFTLCDTIGVAYPSLVREVFSAVRSAFPDDKFCAHIHDTRNMGILNTLTAIECGADSVQTSVGGLGGCPFAPGASGNTASEDLIYLLDREGYETGVSFDKVLETALLAKREIDGNFSGHHINITAQQCGFTTL